MLQTWLKTTGTAITLAASLSVTTSYAYQHGLAMHGELKYPADFNHFEYTNPNAPKGGQATLASIGSYDSFNPFIIKGTSPTGLGLLFDSLMEKALDEPFSQYGLLAKGVELAEDRSKITYYLHETAKFHDGSPVTAHDVVFTFETLLEKGQPFYKAYYGDIDTIIADDDYTVTFTFKNTDNRELPLIIGEAPIFSKAFWQDKDFSKPSLEVPLGSGPYQVAEFEAGKSITYQLNPNYWAKDLAVNKGNHNIGALKYDFYLDETVSLEAFKAGEYDFRQEYSSKRWATAYNSDALTRGDIVTEEIKHQNPTGMQAFVFNTRKGIFADAKTRQALSYAFDFEWSNKNLFYGAYTRSHSFFSNSEMAATELPDAKELAILEPFRAQLPAEVFTQVYQAPTTDGSGNNRRQLRTAKKLLTEAGWQYQGGQLVDPNSGQPLTFEVLLASPTFERVVAPMLKNLERLGIKATMRTVDVSQYINRVRDFDFDMVVGSFAQSSSPGNEQRDYWASSTADLPGSRNLIGVKDPVVDALIEKIINAQTREELVLTCRALDRVLQWSYYVIPQFHISSYRVAYWNKFERPEIAPKKALGFSTWWIKDAGEK
ncbi:MAG: extracellular solute-binding protein [Pontibacterium sp.]